MEPPIGLAAAVAGGAAHAAKGSCPLRATAGHTTCGAPSHSLQLADTLLPLTRCRCVDGGAARSMCDPAYFQDEIERDAPVMHDGGPELEFLRPVDYSDVA
jgi:hypothetical protein